MKNGWMLKGLLFLIVATVATAAVVMWLWNWLMPDLLSTSTISFIQSLGLLLLCRILFRGFNGWKSNHHYFTGRSNWREKWDKMSPDEKDKLRTLWKQRCSTFSCDSERQINK